MAHLQVNLLGNFEALNTAQSEINFRTNKVQALLAYLLTEYALQSDRSKTRPHRREMMMSLLWPGLPTKSAQVNLRQIIYRLRKDLTIVESADFNTPTTPVLSDRTTLTLNKDAAIQSDVAQFIELIEFKDKHEHIDLLTCSTCLAKLIEATTLYRGGFLNDFYLPDSNAFEEWAHGVREYLRRQNFDALETITKIFLQAGNFSDAKKSAEEIIKQDQLKESGHRLLMESLARSGHRSAALAQYEKYRLLLYEEFGMSPETRISELYAQIKGGEVDLGKTSQPPIRGYDVQEEIGSGAFGNVYRAHQPSVSRDVAIKVIKPQFANNPEFIRRFEFEAQVVAQLEHPHVVPLYDYWRQPDGAYLVMRYLRGGTLRDAVVGKPWKLEKALPLIEQVAAGLGAAHKQGIVHRDINPNNIMLDTEGYAYVTDFGIARAQVGTTQMTVGGGIIGTLDYISPEQIKNEPVSPQTDIYGLGMVLYYALSGEKPYPSSTAANVIYNHLQDPVPRLHQRFPDIPVTLDDVLQKATAKNPSHRHTDMANFIAELQAAVGSPQVAFGPALRYVPEEEVFNPYKGLQPFQESDSNQFYGRDALVGSLIEQMKDHQDHHRFLAVVGPSGSGKSSAVKAGLIPLLRHGTIKESQDWFYIDMVPSTHPLEELEAALLRIAVNPPPSLLEPLQKDERGLLRTLKRILPVGSGQLLLFIDQFEELFTLVEDEAVRAHFIDSLVTALSSPNSHLRVVITLRADFYDRPLQYTALGQLLKQRTTVVLPLQPEELEAAITQPAAQMGVAIEPGIVSDLLTDVGGETGALPLLQYALTELFEKRDGNLITRDVYEEIGGVSGALSRRADNLFQALDQRQQRMARQLFLRLVNLGEDDKVTKRRVGRAALEAVYRMTGYEEVEGLTAILDAFGKARLLSFDRDPVTRESTVEMAHEALLREWAILREWLTENRDDIRLQRQLAAAASDWQMNGEDESYLLQGSRLNLFESWSAESMMVLSPTEQEFLSASITTQQAIQKAEEERRQNELLQAQRLAETERQRAEEQRTAASKLRQRAWLLVGALAIAVGLAAFALVQRNQAQVNFESAEKLRLAAQAENITEQSVGAVLPALLSLQSLNYGYSIEADAALTNATRQGFAYQTFFGHRDLIASSTYSHNSDLFVTGGNDGSAKLWSAGLGELVHDLRGHTDAVTAVAFSANDEIVYTGGADRIVRSWHVATAQPRDEFPMHNATVWALAINNAGTKLVTNDVDEDGNYFLHLWDAETQEETGRFYGHTDTILTALFTADGTTLITGGLDRTIRLWDVETQALAQTIEGHAGSVSSLDVSADGTQLVSASYDNTARLWDVASGTEMMRFLGHINILQQATFIENDSMILTTSEDATTRFWDVNSGLEIRRYGGSSMPGRTPLSPDGNQLVAVDFEGVIRLWDVDSTLEPIKLERPFRTMHAADIVYLSFSADDTLAYTGSGDGTLHTWQVSTGELLDNVQYDSSGFILDFTISPDGSLVATTKGDGTITIWDAPSRNILQEWVGHDGEVWAVKFLPNSQQLISVSEDGVARVWDARSGAELMALKGHTGAITSVAISPTGDLFATGSTDQTVRLWDGATGEQMRLLEGHTNTVQSVAFTPSGNQVVSGSLDQTARLWDVSNGREVQQLAGHAGGVDVVNVSPDGSLILTGSDDSTVRLWATDTGEPVRQLVHEDVGIRTVEFSSDGKRLISGEVRFAHLWHTHIEDVIDLACGQLPRVFTEDEVSQFDLKSTDLPCESVPNSLEGDSN